MIELLSSVQGSGIVYCHVLSDEKYWYRQPHFDLSPKTHLFQDGRAPLFRQIHLRRSRIQGFGNRLRRY